MTISLVTCGTCKWGLLGVRQLMKLSLFLPPVPWRSWLRNSTLFDLVGGLVPMRMPLPLWDSDEPSKKSGDHETPVSSINLGTALQLAEDHSAPQNCKVVTEQKGPKNLAIGVETFDLGRNLINAAIQGRGVNHPVIILGIIFISRLETPRLTNKS